MGTADAGIKKTRKISRDLTNSGVPKKPMLNKRHGKGNFNA